MTNCMTMYDKLSCEKMTKREQISDNNSTYSERIIVRIDPLTKKELYKEMKEKKINKISTYLRIIIANRNKKNVKILSNNNEKNERIGQKEYIKITSYYNELLQKFKEFSTQKDADGRPIFNQKEFYEKIKILNDNTIEMARLLKKFVNDNPNSK